MMRNKALFIGLLMVSLAVMWFSYYLLRDGESADQPGVSNTDNPVVLERMNNQAVTDIRDNAVPAVSKAVEMKEEKEPIGPGGNKASYVNWSGYIRDYDGSILYGARITIQSALKYNKGHLKRGVYADNNGFFSFPRLPLGSYRLTIYFYPNHTDIYAGDYPAGMINFDVPGDIHKDVILERGGVISGVVIDNKTGRSIVNLEGYSSCSVYFDDVVKNIYRYVYCDDKGRFVCKWLKPATYKISANVSYLVNNNTKSMQASSNTLKIDLAKNQVIKGIIIPIKRKGLLIVHLHGFTDDDFQGSSYDYIPKRKPGLTDDRESIGWGKPNKNDNGEYRLKQTLDPGDWIFQLRSSLGVDRREVHINAGEETVIHINKTDKKSHRWIFDQVRVTGILHFIHGSPVVGIPVTLRKISTSNNNAGQGTILTATTDKGGWFEFRDVRPGHWELQYNLNDTLYNGGITISDYSENACIFASDLSKCVIKGKIMDMETHDPIEKCWIELSYGTSRYYPNRNSKVANEKGYNIDIGGNYRICYPFPEEFTLKVKAEGYKDYVTKIEVKPSDEVKQKDILMERIEKEFKK